MVEKQKHFITLGIQNQHMKQLYFFVLAFLTGSVANAQIVNIPDAAFKSKLLEASPSNYIASGINLTGSVKIDTNNNGEIEETEAAQIGVLNITNAGIADLTGIEAFVNLRTAYFNNNNVITVNLLSLTNLEQVNFANNPFTTFSVYPGIKRLEVSGVDLGSLDATIYPQLENLVARNCHLTGLNISGLPLKHLDCSDNLLTTIDVTAFGTLSFFNCKNNLLTSLSLPDSGSITYLDCSLNTLTTLMVGNYPGLKTLIFNNNEIHTFHMFTPEDEMEDLSAAFNQLTTFEMPNQRVANFDIRNNLLTSLDLSNVGLYRCGNNQIKYLFVKNGYAVQPGQFNIQQFNIYPNPFEYICADENNIATFQTLMTAYDIADCEVNSYCTFMPGGDLYTMSGNVRFDANGDGCDGADIAVSKAGFVINATPTGFTGSDGNYFFYATPFINYTIAPQLEHQSYFTVTPHSATHQFWSIEGFPTEFVQDFCIAPNGSHTDASVTITPTLPARPGFDSPYRINYKNTGTVPISGTITLAFDDTRCDFLESSPVISGQSAGQLNWTFSNLLPFESRIVAFKMNLNSPTETPSLNSGDVLDFTATALVASDETSQDNVSVLHQTVINSFDPNDKTCIEGTTVGPEMAGQYIHYQIRFENTGTASAVNIVVKDMIDTAKFDIVSLIPLDGSHDFVTRINGNKVEFIFENINLPFDDANNDGYVVFKIKTKPTLVLGDTFSNTASIYFDYNHPIVTDPAVTTIALLQTQDFEFSDYFSIYPNPANDRLNIRSKQAMEINTISVYNALGQLVLVVPSAQQMPSVDVSGLKAGHYFLKVDSGNGTSNCKFIKK
jgi:hypothetical protein